MIYAAAPSAKHLRRLCHGVRAMRTANKALQRACKSCAYVNLCRNCPAHAYLETGDMQAIPPYFCQVAHARAEMLSSADPGIVTCAPSR